MEPTTPLRAGSPVRIVGGTYAGQEGTVVKDPVGPKVRVNSPTLGKEVCVMQSNVTAIALLKCWAISTLARQRPHRGEKHHQRAHHLGLKLHFNVLRVVSRQALVEAWLSIG